MQHHANPAFEPVASFRKINQAVMQLRDTPGTRLESGRLHVEIPDTSLNDTELELLRAGLRHLYLFRPRHEDLPPSAIDATCQRSDHGLVFEFTVNHKAPTYSLQMALAYIQEQLTNAHFIGDMWAMDDARIHLKLPPETVMAISQQLQREQRGRL